MSLGEKKMAETEGAGDDKNLIMYNLKIHFLIHYIYYILSGYFLIKSRKRADRVSRVVKEYILFLYKSKKK